ncbi:MAG: 2-hydroxyhepta-2,4-diene-1,7-dioate isomerase [Flavobacteriales bacterium]|nr:2-hydroxyhepta-2,4-diene-1,7-dioate isomerase [Flavobacteriales bacterium]|tara:strand:+ start:34664 stop:35275 length:612 start_codon:yes stop_codon:yes gene_type:complete
MKIICVTRNYKQHALELNNKIPTELIFFLKPETAIPIKGQPFFIPDFSNEIHYELEVVIKINKTGKHIQERFAHKYFDELSLGIDFTARDLQSKLKKMSFPWEMSKSFDGSAPIGFFVKKQEFKDINNLNFELTVNNDIKQSGNTKNMIFSFNHIISYVSKYITLKKGDLIFTGTPKGVGKVRKNDFLIGKIEGKQIIQIKIK